MKIHQKINQNAANSVFCIFYKRKWIDNLGWKYSAKMNVSAKRELMPKIAEKLFNLGFDCDKKYLT